MKRKVIKQGNGTLTITLPKQWTKEANVKSGIYVDLFPKGKELRIVSSIDRYESCVSVDLKDITNPKVIRSILISLHKTGYDIFEIFYDTPAKLNMIQKQVQELYTGFAIMEQSPTRVVFRALTVDLDKELEPSLKRAFHVTFALADSIEEMMEKKSFNNILELLTFEKSNNQFTNFCERALAKGNFPATDKICFKYVIIWNIEKVCDCLADLCIYIDSNKLISISPALVKLYKSINRLAKDYYDLIYKFNFKSYEDVVIRIQKLGLELSRYRVRKNEEVGLIHSFENILDRVSNFSGATIALNTQSVFKNS
jgi:hypothetical protein